MTAPQIRWTICVAVIYTLFVVWRRGDHTAVDIALTAASGVLVALALAWANKKQGYWS
jgi:hypothetical protein